LDPRDEGARAALTFLAAFRAGGFALAAARSFAGFAAGTFSRPARNSSARATIFSSIAPASPPRAGRLDNQISGRSWARISAKSPSLFTLSGANSAMSSSGDDQASRCLISSQLRPPSRGVRTSTHDPFSLKPSNRIFRSPRASAASTSGTSGSHVPRSHNITIPAPYPSGMTPSNVP